MVDMKFVGLDPSAYKNGKKKAAEHTLIKCSLSRNLPKQSLSFFRAQYQMGPMTTMR